MIAVAAIGVAWAAIAVALGATPHRLKRAAQAADPGEQYEPYTPQPESTWMDLVSSDCLRDSDPLLHERFAHIISAEWEWSE